MKINSNHVFRAVDREMVLLHAWLSCRAFDVFGYPASVIIDRLTQLVVDVLLEPYALLVATLNKTSVDSFPAVGTKIRTERFTLEIGTGELSISVKQWMRNQLVFIAHWLYCFFSILSPKFFADNAQPAVLVLGFTNRELFVDHSDERLVSYCRSGPIVPLRDGKRFLVQTKLRKGLVSTHPDFSYSRNPLITFLRETRMGAAGRLKLLGKHVALLFVYVLASIRMPQISLIGKDFPYVVIAADLDRRNAIDAVVLTCSSFTEQQLWMRGLRNARTHMLWYAQNWKPHAYLYDNLTSDISQLHWIRVDIHWVWTHAFAQYLKSLNPDASVEVVGPIVWYLPEIRESAKDRINIVIFDVSPYHDNIALRYGEISNYNHPDNLFVFIKDLLALREELEHIYAMPVSLTLKTKRGFDVAYDRAYFDYIEELGRDGSISLESHSTNIYTLISSSHLVIVYPFTSPAYIAEYLGIPCVYYDPTRTIIQQDVSDSPELVKFVNSREGLLNTSVSLLSKEFPVKKPNLPSFSGECVD